MGRKDFQVSAISRSYRIRGRVPRIQINVKATINDKRVWKISENAPIRDKGINRVVVKMLIIIILAYSAIKIRAKLPLLYSTLKPETSSDSPSAKSKGVRLVSARVVIYQLKNIGNIMSAGHVVCWDKIILKLKDINTSSTDKRISAILTS